MALNQVLELIPDEVLIGSLKIENPKELIKLVNLSIVEHDIDAAKISEKSTGGEFKKVISLLPEDNIKEILEKYFLGNDSQETKEDEIDKLEIEERKFKLGALKAVVVLAVVVIVIFVAIISYIAISTKTAPDASVTNGFLSNIVEIFKIIIGTK